MREGLLTLIAGLGGALLGGAAAVAAQVVALQGARREDRRRERRELLATLWAATDRLWRSAQSLWSDIFVLGNVERSQDDAASERRQYYNDRYQESFRNRAEANTESLFLIAQLRLLRLDAAADAAEALRAASETYEHETRDEQRAARQAALDEFERQARTLID